MVITVEQLVQMVRIMIFQHVSKNGEMLKYNDETIKKNFVMIIVFTLDI